MNSMSSLSMSLTTSIFILERKCKAMSFTASLKGGGRKEEGGREGGREDERIEGKEKERKEGKEGERKGGRKEWEREKKGGRRMQVLSSCTQACIFLPLWRGIHSIL